MLIPSRTRVASIIASRNYATEKNALSISIMPSFMSTERMINGLFSTMVAGCYMIFANEREYEACLDFREIIVIVTKSIFGNTEYSPDSSFICVIQLLILFNGVLLMAYLIDMFSRRREFSLETRKLVASQEQKNASQIERQVAATMIQAAWKYYKSWRYIEWKELNGYAIKGFDSGVDCHIQAMFNNKLWHWRKIRQDMKAMRLALNYVMDTEYENPTVEEICHSMKKIEKMSKYNSRPLPYDADDDEQWRDFNDEWQLIIAPKSQRPESSDKPKDKLVATPAPQVQIQISGSGTTNSSVSSSIEQSGSTFSRKTSFFTGGSSRKGSFFGGAGSRKSSFFGGAGSRKGSFFGGLDKRFPQNRKVSEYSIAGYTVLYNTKHKINEHLLVGKDNNQLKQTQSGISVTGKLAISTSETKPKPKKFAPSPRQTIMEEPKGVQFEEAAKLYAPDRRERYQSNASSMDPSSDLVAMLTELKLQQKMLLDEFSVMRADLQDVRAELKEVRKNVTGVQKSALNLLLPDK